MRKSGGFVTFLRLFYAFWLKKTVFVCLLRKQYLHLANNTAAI